MSISTHITGTVPTRLARTTRTSERRARKKARSADERAPLVSNDTVRLALGFAMLHR